MLGDTFASAGDPRLTTAMRRCVMQHPRELRFLHSVAHASDYTTHAFAAWACLWHVSLGLTIGPSAARGGPCSVSFRTTLLFEAYTPPSVPHALLACSESRMSCHTAAANPCCLPYPHTYKLLPVCLRCSHCQHHPWGAVSCPVSTVLTSGGPQPSNAQAHASRRHHGTLLFLHPSRPPVSAPRAVPPQPAMSWNAVDDVVDDSTSGDAVAAAGGLLAGVGVTALPGLLSAGDTRPGLPVRDLEARRADSRLAALALLAARSSSSSDTVTPYFSRRTFSMWICTIILPTCTVATRWWCSGPSYPP